MVTVNSHKWFIFFSAALWMFSCSHAGLQPKREKMPSANIPDCQKNASKEGGLISEPVYKTWVKYDHLEFKKGFDLAIQTLQSHKHWILSADPGSGTINTQMFLEAEQKTGYPVTLKLVDNNSSVAIHMSLRTAWGTFNSPDLCSFYDEFGKNIKRASVRVEIKQPSPSPQKQSQPEAEKEASSSSPSASSLPSQVSSTACPTPVESPKASPPPQLRGKVTWTYVNLRGGPGVQHKIIAKAHKEDGFEILDEDSGWLRVRFENGKEGWMNKRATSEASKTLSSSSPADFHDSSRTRFSSKGYGPM